MTVRQSWEPALAQPGAGRGRAQPEQEPDGPEQEPDGPEQGRPARALEPPDPSVAPEVQVREARTWEDWARARAQGPASQMADAGWAPDQLVLQEMSPRAAPR